MKNAFKLIGIIALAALIGFSFVACGDDSGGGPTGNPGGTDNPGGGGGGGGANSALNGSWRDDDGSILRLNNGNFSVFEGSVEMGRGTYTTSGSTITMTFTHIYMDAEEAAEYNTSPGMKTRSQYMDILRAYVNNNLSEFTQAQKDQFIASLERVAFSPTSGTYSVSGNTLTMDGDNFTRIN